MRIKKSLIVGIFVAILLIGGVIVGLYLNQQQQDIRQHAAEPSPTPACVDNVSTCEWDPLPGAASYQYKVVETDSNTTIAEDNVDSTTTKITFTSEPNKTYECSVAAVNACGTGLPGSASATCTVNTPTPTPTDTPIPTPTSNLPTDTPTQTPTPTPTIPGVPTDTPTPTPTETPIPTDTLTPTPTDTPVPTDTLTPTPTPTTVIATNTPVPSGTPTDTPTPTNTPAPGVPTDTSTPTPTLVNPGSGVETFTIAGGVILTIIGALILFAL